MTIALISLWVAKLGGFFYLAEKVCAVVGGVLKGPEEMQ
nr:MAG: hypothetical protein [Microvirus sp.]